MKIRLLAAAIALTLFGVLPASAATVYYTFTGVGSGVYTDGSDVTAFTDVKFVIHSTLDTSTLFTDSGGDIGLKFISASISALGQTADIALNSDYAIVLGSAHPGVLILGAPPFTSPAAFGSPSLVGYDAVSDLGPIAITYFGNLDPTFTNGADADFTSITDGTFTASTVPEPATWAMMLVGLGGLGAAARLSRRNQTAVTG